MTTPLWLSNTAFVDLGLNPRRTPVIGAGGIMDATDAVSFFMAGAGAIQIGTATFVDPYAIPKVIKGIKNYLKKPLTMLNWKKVKVVKKTLYI